MDYLRELTAKGAKVRIAYEPLERLIICDRAAALTPIDPAETTKGGAILTRDPGGLVAALVSLFERMWQTAHDLPTIEESEDKGTSLVNGLQRDILRSLYTSEKDEIGARELGIASGPIASMWHHSCSALAPQTAFKLPCSHASAAGSNLALSRSGLTGT